MKEPRESRRVRGVTREVVSAAQHLRSEMTTAERALWEAIKEKKLGGLRFRRQHPVGRFIFDFYCPSLRLVIEVDGGVHDEAGQADRDCARDAELHARGYHVLRFRNEEVMHDLPFVLAHISGVARAISASAQT